LIRARPSLASSRSGRSPAASRAAAGQPPALHDGLPQADHRQRHMGQRRQVPAGPQGALGRDHGMDPPVEHLDEQLEDLRADPGVAPGQGVQPGHHHRPHLLLRELRSHPHRVALQQVVLQKRRLLRGDADVPQMSEPGGHPVDHRPPGEQSLHRLPASSDPSPGLGGQGHRAPSPGYRHHILQGEMFAVQLQRRHRHGLLSFGDPCPSMVARLSLRREGTGSRPSGRGPAAFPSLLDPGGIIELRTLNEMASAERAGGGCDD